MAHPVRRREQSWLGSTRFVVRRREQVDLEFLLVRPSHFLHSHSLHNRSAESLVLSASSQVHPFSHFFFVLVLRPKLTSRLRSLSRSLSIDLRKVRSADLVGWTGYQEHDWCDLASVLQDEEPLPW